MTISDQTTVPDPLPNVDLRHLISSELMDQGPRPVCVPFAITHAHEALIDGQTEKLETTALAPEAIWWHCCAHGMTSQYGMTLRSGGAALRSSGQPLLTEWPWNPGLGVSTEPPPAAAGSPPWRRALTMPIEIAHDNREDAIEDALAAGHPVIILIEVTEEFENAAADGSIQIPDIRSPAGDYHAVLAVGAATHPEAGRRLLIRNSWPPSYWGAGGYGWLPLGYLVANSIQAAVVVTGRDSDEKTPSLTSEPAQLSMPI